MSGPQKFYITTAINYPNGEPHIGHAYEGIATDAIARFERLDGKDVLIEADGVLATCLQHEIDHLNGILFIDHLSRLKRDMIMKKLIKARREMAGQRAA